MPLVTLFDLLLPMTGIRLVTTFWVVLIVMGAITAYLQVDWVPTGTGKHPLGCYLTIIALGGLIISLLIGLIL